MEVKTIEIRDRATFIPAMATLLAPRDERDRYLLRRAGYGQGAVILTRLDSGKSENDPYEWGGRTLPVAHEHLMTHWAEIENGQVLDVEFILKEKPTAKVSEQHEYPI